MAKVKRIVVDILKPYEPSTIEFARRISDHKGVEGVNATLLETDKEVQNLKLTIEGKDVSYERTRDEIQELGGTVHSVDQVVCGAMVEEIDTPQD